MGYPALKSSSHPYSSPAPQTFRPRAGSTGNVIRPLQFNAPEGFYNWSPDLGSPSGQSGGWDYRDIRRETVPGRYAEPPLTNPLRPGRVRPNLPGSIYRLPVHYVAERGAATFAARALTLLHPAGLVANAFLLGFDLYTLYSYFRDQQDPLEPWTGQHGWDFSGWNVDCYIGPGTPIGNLHACSATTWWTATNATFAANIANPIVDVGSAYVTCYAANIRPHPLAPTTHTQWNSYAKFSKVKPYDYTQDEPGPGIALPYATQPLGIPFDPFSLPIGQPAPIVRPLPWKVVPARVPSPWRSPMEQTWRGPLPPRRYVGFPQPVYPDLPWLGPSQHGQPGKSHHVDVVGGSPPLGRLNTSDPPPSRYPRPPKKRTKERKFVLNRRTAFMRLVSFITEARDFVDAMYRALPKDARRRARAKHQNKAAAIYENFLDLDIPLAFKYWFENEIEDRFYGLGGRIAGKGKRKAFDTGYDPSHKGPQLGGRYRPQADPGEDNPYVIPDIIETNPYTIRDALEAAGWV